MLTLSQRLKQTRRIDSFSNFS